MTIGIEWVNNYHSASSNLSNNDKNARGFYNRLQGQRMFEYGNDLAWDQDFEEKGAGTPPAGSDQLYADHVDIVFFSQSLHHALHPGRALVEAARILKPGGSIAILDLAKHRFEEAREMYADEWLGFSEVELESMLVKAGLFNVQTSVVDRETESPYFQSLLAVASKSERPGSIRSE